MEKFSFPFLNVEFHEFLDQWTKLNCAKKYEETVVMRILGFWVRENNFRSILEKNYIGIVFSSFSVHRIWCNIQRFVQECISDENKHLQRVTEGEGRETHWTIHLSSVKGQAEASTKKSFLSKLEPRVCSLPACNSCIRLRTQGPLNILKWNWVERWRIEKLNV